MHDINKHIPITNDLLAKYFAGEASPPEAMAIDSWINESDLNRQEFEALFNAWDQTSRQPYTLPEAKQAWLQIEPQLKPGRKMQWMKLSIAAALLAVISTIGFFFFSNRGKESIQTNSFTSTTKRQQLLLADSTSVTTNANSILTYPSAFIEKERTVQLKGEAFFDVKHNAAKPFIVKCSDVQVRVLGTAFNIQEQDSSTKTTVYRGKVMMYNKMGELIISAGQTGMYNRYTHTFSLLSSASKNEISYVSLNFYFENETLKNIVDNLSKAYHQKIHIDDPSLTSLRLSSTFEHETLEYILDVIATTLNIQFTSINHEIHITKK